MPAQTPQQGQQQAPQQGGQNQPAQGVDGGFNGQGVDPFNDSAINPFIKQAPQQQGQQQGSDQNMPTGMMQQPPANNQEGFASPDINGQQGGSPLDTFLPKVDNVTDGMQAPQQQGQQPPPQQQEPAKSIFDNTLDSYHKLVAKNNFVGDISPESMQKIMQGDVAELTNVINGAVRQGVASSAFTSARVAQSGMNSQFDGFQKDTLPGLLTDHSFTQGNGHSDNSVLSHPTVAPLVKQQTALFRSQFPEASVHEIQAKVTEYFNALAGAFTNQTQTNAQAEEEQQQASSTSLEQFFNM